LACLWYVGVAHPTQLTNFGALSRHSPKERKSDLRGVFYKLLRPELVFAYKQKHNVYLCSDAFTAWVCLSHCVCACAVVRVRWKKKTHMAHDMRHRDNLILARLRCAAT
jgi:hypothetical protein